MASNVPSNQITPDSCTDSGYQIYKETAKMWEDSWKALHPFSDSSSQYLPFPTSDIAALRLAVSGSEGIRIYYCKMDNSIIPSLAMVNIIGCENQYGNNGDAILFSDRNRGQYFESKDTLFKYAQLWKDYMDNRILAIHTPVYAYDYSWSELASTINFNQTSNVYVAHGMRTLSADEYGEYNCNPPTNSGLMGSIVYCNILYGNDPGILGQEYFNFAKPCPVYCDPAFLNCIQ